MITLRALKFKCFRSLESWRNFFQAFSVQFLIPRMSPRPVSEISQIAMSSVYPSLSFFGSLVPQIASGAGERELGGGPMELAPFAAGLFGLGALAVGGLGGAP